MQAIDSVECAVRTDSQQKLRAVQPARWLVAWVAMPMLLGACSQQVNSPYPASDAGKSILYSAFEERPKHLDPARSYSENEFVFLGNIYEPPLTYHYLKRPYQLIPESAAALPTVLGLGVDPYNYDVNYVTLSVRYRFGALPATAEEAE